jgi:hypothetical protein
VRVVLKKTWRSNRGKMYPSGTIFTKSQLQSAENIDSTWYKFVIPEEAYGIVLIPNEYCIYFTD